LINTLRGLALDPTTHAPVLARGSGGLSGPSLKPIALHAVYTCFAATRLPIVGMGGVACAQDVVDMVACGARHVALGTALFSNPELPNTIRDALADVDFDGLHARAHNVNTSCVFAA
jgi:dihydroorotate dehydrogenase (NAD+) catalytic subunit